MDMVRLQGPFYFFSPGGQKVLTSWTSCRVDFYFSLDGLLFLRDNKHFNQSLE